LSRVHRVRDLETKIEALEAEQARLKEEESKLELEIEEKAAAHAELKNSMEEFERSDM
jgi:predicted RNase H-like nuclease (RuvC/YqgF family)